MFQRTAANEKIQTGLTTWRGSGQGNRTQRDFWNSKAHLLGARSHELGHGAAGQGTRDGWSPVRSAILPQPPTSDYKLAVDDE